MNKKHNFEKKVSLFKLKDFIFYYLLFLYLPGVELLYNIVLVFAIQYHESVICMHISLPPSITPLGQHRALSCLCHAYLPTSYLTHDSVCMPVSLIRSSGRRGEVGRESIWLEEGKSKSMVVGERRRHCSLGIGG